MWGWTGHETLPQTICKITCKVGDWVSTVWLLAMHQQKKHAGPHPTDNTNQLKEATKNTLKSINDPLTDRTRKTRSQGQSHVQRARENTNSEPLSAPEQAACWPGRTRTTPSSHAPHNPTWQAKTRRQAWARARQGATPARGLQETDGGEGILELRSTQELGTLASFIQVISCNVINSNETWFYQTILRLDSRTEC